MSNFSLFFYICIGIDIYIYIYILVHTRTHAHVVLAGTLLEMCAGDAIKILLYFEYTYIMHK